jgi:hypothetical protein
VGPCEIASNPPRRGSLLAKAWSLCRPGRIGAGMCRSNAWAWRSRRAICTPARARDCCSALRAPASSLRLIESDSVEHEARRRPFAMGECVLSSIRAPEGDIRSTMWIEASRQPSAIWTMILFTPTCAALDSSGCDRISGGRGATAGDSIGPRSGIACLALAPARVGGDTRPSTRVLASMGMAAGSSIVASNVFAAAKPRLVSVVG